MTQDAPLITITDPQHPAPLQEPAPLVERHLRRSEQVLVRLLAVLLLAGAGVARDLRARERLDQVRLSAVVTNASSESGDGLPALVLGVDLEGDARDDLNLEVLAVEGGWSVVDSSTVSLTQGSSVSLALRREIDCRARVLAPATMRVRLRVKGLPSREATVRVANHDAGPIPDVAGFCGDLPAVRAVTVLTSELNRVGTTSTVSVELANASVYPVTVQAVLFPGFAFTPSTPLALAPREAGVLRRPRLEGRRLTVDAKVVDCGTARAALDNAEQSGTPNLVSVQVSGRGGTGLATIDVRGLESYLDAQWRSSCG